MNLTPNKVYESPNGSRWEYIGRTQMPTEKPYIFRGLSSAMVVHADDKGHSDFGPLIKEGSK